MFPFIILKNYFNIFTLTFSVQFHIAHLFEIQSKYDLAKEAYQAIISVQGMPPNIQSAAWRQLGT